MRNLTRANWLDVAKSLTIGKNTRIQCCASDNSALVSHSSRGYSMHCFRCGDNPFVPHGERSIKEILLHREQQMEFIRSPLALPGDYTQDLPDHALCWVGKAGVSASIALHYGIGWSAFLDRVVLPVYDEKGTLQYMQGRSLDPKVKPKYLNKSGTQVRSVVFWSDPAVLLPSSTPEPGLCIVTEDMLSCIRVGRVQHSVSILGTTLTDERAATLISRFSRFIIWLDGDKAGIKGRKHAYRKLVLQGADVQWRCTPLDPKLYTNRQIKEIISGSE